ncbi:MAG: 16S rRNA (cytosine(1402)-N(4))-methyltransferase RsmH, partial [Vicinamibacteria bacterium]
MQNGKDDVDRGTKPKTHVPVLLAEVLELVGARPGGLYVDATLGGGGYTEALLRASDPSGRVVAFDRDREAIEAAKERLGDDSDRLSFVWGSFADLDPHLEGLDELVDGIVADLGLSSLQLDCAERGFTFAAEGPLDMRFDRSQDLTAAELVNETDERELERILRDYGDERRARAIARRIVSRRPLRTTTDLRRAVVSVLGPWKGGIDPATRTFQAIRIAVNRELEALETFLAKAPDRLRVEGRLVVVSYHSLEDRAVKLAFRAR